MHLPVFFAFDLEHEYVMHVIVRVESPGRLRRYVGVDLSRVPELLDQAAGKGLYRGPRAVQPLQDDCRAIGEFPKHHSGIDLVGHLGAEPARGGVARRRQDRALLRQPDERRAQGPVSEQLVGGRRGKQV